MWFAQLNTAPDIQRFSAILARSQNGYLEETRN